MTTALVRPTTQTPAGPAIQTAMANAVRALSMDAVERAGSGHPGMPLGMADVATVLFTRYLKFDPTMPDWPDRDRFVLSAGHGSMLIYALHYLIGTKGVDLADLKAFRQLHSKTAGHPEFGHCPGVETTTGPLGQGLATGVGMALAEQLLNARFGDDLVDHHTYVLVGDGCLMEGISHEAIDLAGHLKLGSLVVLFDDNGISIDGPTSLTTSMDQCARFAAAGWHTASVDAHDPEAVAEAIALARADDRPSLIACKSVIGFGAPAKQGSSAAHGAPLGADEIAATRQALDWAHPPFEIPDQILAAWRAAAESGRQARHRWEQRLSARDDGTGAAFQAAIDGKLPTDFDQAIAAIKRRFATEKPKLATRQSSQAVLEALADRLPTLLGGSADLTGSNGTLTSSHAPVGADDFAGNYIHYGVREHAMAAAMNGVALHGGFIPYGGTFFVFSDYSRPAIRLAALMKQRVIHVMTHDSIGLGEDGPTHQPVEHLASLRAMPNILVLRPADAIETAEAWACALKADATPSILCLSRQGLPTLRDDAADDNQVAKGAYMLRKPAGEPDVTLLATGSEVALAVEAAQKLEHLGIKTAVVSMPCWELFAMQSATYRDRVLGRAPRVAVEAGVRTGWNRWIGPRGRFVGLDDFGASAPAPDLYDHFSVTVEAIVDAAQAAVASGA